jgi:hypothetical protein
MKIIEDDVGKRYRRRDGAVVLITCFKNNVAKSDGKHYEISGTIPGDDNLDLIECLDDEEHLLCPCGCQLDREVAEEFDSGAGYFERHLANHGMHISKSITLEQIAKALPIDKKADARATEVMDEIYRKETHRKI